MRGGSGCALNKNLGEQFTLRPYNNLSSATPRGAYESTNNNYNVPTPYNIRRRFLGSRFRFIRLVEVVIV